MYNSKGKIMTYNVSASAKAITAKIAGIGRSVDTLNTNIQTVLEMIVVHGKECGDVSGLGRLVNTLRKRNMVVGKITRFMATHTSIAVGNDNANKGMFKSYLRKDDDGNRVAVTAKMVEAVKANKWHEFEIEPDQAIITEIELEKRVENTISFIDRLLKGEAKSKKLNKSDEAAARGLRNRLHNALHPDTAPRGAAVGE